MNRPDVKKGDWIKIGTPGVEGQIYGYVIDLYPDGKLGVGYYQNGLKTIKKEVDWIKQRWEFVEFGGSYLDGQVAAIVKAGPFHSS